MYFSQNYSAGVLLYRWVNDEVYFLLGNDNKYKCWSDFGGKCEHKDRSDSIHTAAREFYEETAGVIMSLYDAQKSLQQSKRLQCLSFKKRPYYMYLLHYEDTNDNIVQDFSNQIKFIKTKQVCKRFKEKNEVKWFTIDDIKNNKVDIRTVFWSSFMTNFNIICNHVNQNRVVSKYF